MAFARVGGAIDDYAAELLVWSDLVVQVRRHRRVTNAAADDPNGPYLQRFLIDFYLHLAPKTTFGFTHACVRFTRLRPQL